MVVYRIISTTTVEPGAYKALYWSEDGIFSTRAVIALVTYEDDKGDQEFAPLVVIGGGMTFRLAGVDYKTGIKLPFDPFSAYYEGFHAAGDIASVADALTRDGSNRRPGDNKEAN